MALTEAQQLWVDALRSGKYEQTTGQLLKDGRYCCLGVACEVAMYHGVIFEYDGENGDLTGNFVGDWLEITTDKGPYTQEKLIDLNDKEKKSFSEIADYIESCLSE